MAEQGALPEAKEKFYVRAVYDYTAERSIELSIIRGQKLLLLSDTESNGWAYVAAENGDGTKTTGWVPYSFLSMSADDPSATDWQDDEYFGSYDTVKLHSEMLADVPRTSTYRNAIAANIKYLTGRIVLDVGAGTGVLSMFAARDGKAKQVIGVEASPFASYARKLVAHNKLSSTVEIIECRVEQAYDHHPLLGVKEKGVVVPVKRVDAIISEWMGTMLIFELMIESVLHARDMFLKPGGAMFPGWCQLYLAPACVPAHEHRHVGVFKDVCGLSFEPLIKDARAFAASKLLFNFDLLPEHLLVDAKDAASMLSLDLHTCEVKDLEQFGTKFRFVCQKAGPLHAFASWWDTTFPNCKQDGSHGRGLVLSTAADQPSTHWKQDLMMLKQPLDVAKGDVIIGQINCTRNPFWRRHLLIEIRYAVQPSSGEPVFHNATYTIWRP